MSRCLLPDIVEDPAPASNVLLIDDLPGLLTAADVAKYSSTDRVISQVLDWIKRGWPKDMGGRNSAHMLPGKMSCPQFRVACCGVAILLFPPS